MTVTVGVLVSLMSGITLDQCPVQLNSGQTQSILRIQSFYDRVDLQAQDLT